MPSWSPASSSVWYRSECYTAYHTTVSSALAVNRMQSNIHLFHSLTFGNRQSVLDVDSPNIWKEVRTCTLKFRRQVSFYWTYTHIGQFCLVQFHVKKLQVGPVSTFALRGAFDYMQCEKLFLYCDCPTISFRRVCLEVYTTGLQKCLRYQSRFLSSNETLKQIDGMRRRPGWFAPLQTKWLD